MDTTSEGLYLVLSNIAIVAAIWLCFYHRRYPEATVAFVVFAISSTYHLCQSGFYCVADLEVLRRADHFFVYSLIIWYTLYWLELPLDIRFSTFFLLTAFLYPTSAENLSSNVFTGIAIGVIAFVAFIYIIFINMKIPRITLIETIIIVALAGTGIGLDAYAGDVTDNNYPYAHGTWHILTMLALFFFISMKENSDIILPERRLERIKII